MDTTNITRAIGKIGLQLKKHSPEMLIAVGAVGTVVSAVLACKATLKVNDIVEETKTQINQVHEALENENISEEIYSEEDSKKDLVIIYAQTAVKLAKLYAPSVLLGVASIGCMIASNNILHKRNVALAAAYTVVDKGFKEYRGRVIDRFGKELDNELKYDIKAKKVEETTVDENGETKVTEKVINVVNHPELGSIYSKFYDDGCLGWTKDPETNLMFLKSQQAWANELLKANGHLFLNEVYDMLGIPRTKAGQIVGWIYNEADSTLDNYVDFGIFDTHRESCRNFVNGYERVILLDFNVEGNIMDLI